MSAFAMTVRISTLVCLPLLASLLATAPARAAGDAEAGQAKSATCAACHGAQGIAVLPNYPILAGQYPDYIVQALKSYRSGARQNAIMKGFASQLNDEDIADLAAWFSSQQGPLRTAPRP